MWAALGAFGGCGGEGGYAVVDADKAVAGDIDAESDAEKCVGERLVIQSHREYDVRERDRVPSSPAAGFGRGPGLLTESVPLTARGRTPVRQI